MMSLLFGKCIFVVHTRKGSRGNLGTGDRNAEYNGTTKAQSTNNGNFEIQIMVDKNENKNVQFSALAEEIYHATEFEDGEVGFIDMGYGVWVGADIFSEIGSKDASERYMKHASKKDKSIEITEINEEWGKLGSVAEKIEALTGGNTEVFGKYDLSLEDEKITDMSVEEMKKALLDLEKSLKAKNFRFIYRVDGETQVIKSNNEENDQ